MTLVQLKTLCKILIKPVLLVASSPSSQQFDTKFKTVGNLNLVFFTPEADSVDSKI